MTPEDEPVDLRLDEEEPRTSGAAEEEPIIVDLDQSVFEVLRRIETTSDPSDWIRAAVQEKAQRDDRAGYDVRARLTELLAEMVRIVDLEQEFAGPEALGGLDALAAHLREVEVLIDKLGSVLDDW